MGGRDRRPLCASTPPPPKKVAAERAGEFFFRVHVERSLKPYITVENPLQDEARKLTAILSKKN